MPPKGAVVLDLGCGAGPDSRNLARAQYDVTGVDVSAAAVMIAQRATARAFNVRQRAVSGVRLPEFIAYDALALPEPLHPIEMIFDGTVYCSLRTKYIRRENLGRFKRVGCG